MPPAPRAPRNGTQAGDRQAGFQGPMFGLPGVILAAAQRLRAWPAPSTLSFGAPSCGLKPRPSPFGAPRLNRPNATQGDPTAKKTDGEGRRQGRCPKLSDQPQSRSQSVDRSQSRSVAPNAKKKTPPAAQSQPRSRPGRDQSRTPCHSQLFPATPRPGQTQSKSVKPVFFSARLHPCLP